MYYYIVNPAAGGGSVNAIQDKLRTRLDGLGINGEFAKTTGRGDASKMADWACRNGYSTIVVVGGDETVNETINGISKDSVAVGIIPIGRSNILATHLGITTWQQGCQVVAARRLSSFGLMAAGQKYFLSALTLGFETDLDKRIGSRNTGWRARMGQLGQGLGHAADFQPLSCSIEVDDQYSLRCQIFSLSVTNQKFLNPEGENKLVVSISAIPSRTQLTTYLWRLLRRSENIEENINTKLLAHRLIINTDPATGIMVDGKVTGRTPIAIRLTDRRIRFITEKPATGFSN